MYLGEGIFHYERMGEFLKVAKDLEVKDISKGVEIPKEKEDVAEITVVDDEEKETEDDEDDEQKQKSRGSFGRMGELNKVAKNLEVKEISNGVEIPNEKVHVSEITFVDDGKKETEDDEPNQTTKNKIRQRQPWNQIPSEVKSTVCPECGKLFTTKGTMVRHWKSTHEDIRYPCNHCDYQATDTGSLQSHISAKHSDRIFKCEQCDYHTKWKANFYTHRKTSHAMTVFNCLS